MVMANKFENKGNENYAQELLRRISALEAHGMGTTIHDKFEGILTTMQRQADRIKALEAIVDGKPRQGDPLGQSLEERINWRVEERIALDVNELRTKNKLLKERLDEQERLLSDTDHRDQQLRRAINNQANEIEALKQANARALGHISDRANEIAALNAKLHGTGPDFVWRGAQPAFTEPKPKVKKSGWINVYSCSTGGHVLGGVFNTRDAADRGHKYGEKPIACVPIEWEEDAS